jgi:uncharacterized caspase-like protein
MQEVLKGYVDNVQLLVDDDQTSVQPTKQNILKTLSDTLEKATVGDTIYFHMSSHGTTLPDRDGDERNGNDETLVPLDVDIVGQLTDDELRVLLKSKLKPGVNCVFFVDACHSGSVLDQRYTCTYQSPLESPEDMYKIQENNYELDGNVLSLSAALDTETAAEAAAGGVFTYALVELLKERGKTLKANDALKVLATKLLPFGQHPVLSLSKMGLFEKLLLE